jgi:hypothetical protein
MDDGSFYLIDPLNGSPAQPLGSHSRMYGFVPGSTTLMLTTTANTKAIDLATGDTSLLPAIDLPEAAALHELLPLGGDRGYVSLAATEAGGSLRYSVAAISDGTIRQIYAEEPAKSIESICASPNGQYLAIRKVTDVAYVHADSSGLPNATEFVDTATGRTDQDVAVPTSTGATETPVSSTERRFVTHTLVVSRCFVPVKTTEQHSEPRRSACDSCGSRNLEENPFGAMAGYGFDAAAIWWVQLLHRPKISRWC